MRLALITLSNEGARVVARLSQRWPEARAFAFESVAGLPGAQRFTRVMELTQQLVAAFDALVFVAPAGLVIRSIGPCLQNTGNDPALVVVDVGGRWAVSLLSGRTGGGPDLAFAVAEALAAEPVVTTTTEALKDLIVGVAPHGPAADVAAEALVAAIAAAVTATGSKLSQVRLVATAELLAAQPAWPEALRRLGLPPRTLEMGRLAATLGLAQCTPDRATAAAPLPECEAIALLAGVRTRLLLPQMLIQGLEVAIAREEALPGDSA